MEIYGNLGGDSGVVAYEFDSASIRVKFRDGWIYTYDYESTGQINVERMKTLASAGRGLNSFISRVVRKNFASKSQ